MVLPMGTIYAITFSIAGFVLGTIGAASFILGFPAVLSGISFPPTWILTFRTLKNSNVRKMHSKERAYLLQIGTFIARERLLRELDHRARVTEVDPTSSPFIEEARKCISHYV